MFFDTAFAIAAQSATLKLEDSVPSLTQDLQRDYCLKHSDAHQIVYNYAQLISNFSTELGEAALSPDFTLYSTSTNALIDGCSGNGPVPLLSPTLTSRKDYLLGQAQQPSIPFKQLDLWYACDTVVVRYEINPNAAANLSSKPVVGMMDIRTTPAPLANRFPYYVQTVYSEFDLVAYRAATGDPC